MKPRGRPSDLPGAERFEHGTRARYVTGCRCDECRAANTRAYHDRQARARAAAAEAITKRNPSDGTCPGLKGKRCQREGTKLYKNAVGGICANCRASLVWNGLVLAGGVRRHLAKLHALGVGYKSVADAASVGHTSLCEILSGRKRKIRRQAELRILAVTAEAIADHAIVDGAATWQLLDELIARGFRKSEIAKRLGMKMPALQIGRNRVLARTAYAVAKLHRTVTAPLVRNLAPAPVYCSCVKPVVFELDDKHYCGHCDELARPEGVANALERQALTKSTRQEIFQMGTAK